MHKSIAALLRGFPLSTRFGKQASIVTKDYDI